MPSLDTLHRIAEALGLELVVDLRAAALRVTPLGSLAPTRGVTPVIRRR